MIGIDSRWSDIALELSLHPTTVRLSVKFTFGQMGPIPYPKKEKGNMI